MKLQKAILLTGALASIGLAGVLDTNDVNARNNPALGGNPAVIAANKKVSVAGGTLLTNAVKQSEVNKDPFSLNNYGNDIAKGKDLAPSDFGAATKFLSYTGSISNSDWYSVRYNNIGNIFWSVDIKAGDNAAAYGLSNGQKYAFSFVEAVESISGAYGKDLGNGLSVGAELAANTYKRNHTNQAAKKAGESAGAAFDSRLKSDTYLTLALGAVYDVLPGQKISVSHKFASARNDNFTNLDGEGKVIQEGNFNENVPAETALGYIYQVNDALQAAVSYKATDGTNYGREIDYDKGNGVGYANHNPSSEWENTKTLPNSTWGLAAAYKLNPAVELQGYGTHTKGYRAAWNDVNLTPGDGWNEGFDFTQIGGNVQWTPDFFSGGTLLFGAFNSRIFNATNGYLLDATTTLVSYSHAL
ncbi:hypothetical protein NO1_0241 [Candidatus Termititenax aidoneus]|uniref:Outer membrane protein n=1 Tax=Termititenax aidoneus TaxID=2218524 RepID=A0A388T993_TERA1|nr:hypothetical protein NO1_0241 [Candidatus Termititenax aidoneus]